MVKYFVLKLYPDKNGMIDEIHASMLRETLEHIGSRWDLNLTDFIVEHGQIKFRFDRENCTYNIIENIADEIGVRPAAIGSIQAACAVRHIVRRPEGGAK